MGVPCSTAADGELRCVWTFFQSAMMTFLTNGNSLPAEVTASAPFERLVHLSFSAPCRLWPCKLQAVRSEVRGRVRLKYSGSNSRQYESNSRGYIWAVYSLAAH